MGLRRLEFSGLRGERFGEIDPAGAGWAVGDDDMFNAGRLRQHRFNHRQQRGGDEKDAGAGILKDVSVMLRRQHGVERRRDNTGADGAEEHSGEGDGVLHDHHRAFLAPDAQGHQQACQTARIGGEVGVTYGAPRVDKGGVRAPARRDIGIQKLGCSIIMSHWPSLRSFYALCYRFYV